MRNFEITIDGKKCPARSGETILTVAKRNSITIPTLCYHPLVEVYGACGVCLVEAAGNPKLMRACATEVRENMDLNTKSPRAEEGRRLALELLLSDHRGDCRPPCMEACPGHTDCQGYVGLIANGEYAAANALIKEQLPLPASIGRVCPHPCETACRRKLVEEPISIAALKRFAGDFDLQQTEKYLPEKQPATGKTVAIIGGGPAGLTMGYYLAQKGHSPEIFEAMPKAGGMLRYGIPQYRLPKDILDREISLIEAMGVKITCNMKVGSDIVFEALEKKFDAVYIGIGAWKSAPMRCEGEDAQGVLGGIDFLIAAAQGEKTTLGKKVAVVGGGNTAMDACRTAIRLGAEKVYVLYRRTRAEMPAEDLEIAEAMEEGVEFKFLVAPTKVETVNGKVSGITLQKMELEEPDASGRRRPVPVEGAVEALALDTVIAAIGQKVVSDGIPVQLTDWHTIAADRSTYLTDREGVFAGGDGINDGPGIAIAAIGHAVEAVNVIDSYLKGAMIPHAAPYVVSREDMTAEDFYDRPKENRVVGKFLDPAVRKRNFDEVADTISAEEAKKEAQRCLECGCADYFECKLIQYGQKYDVHPQRFGGEKQKLAEVDEHPYIERNAEKCILCGLCVRVCEEVTGVGALGLVGRGFDTLVKPEFDTPLKDTDCISCGQCVNLCPTGALLEKWPLGKRVPLREEKISSVCTHCGIGCKTQMATKGDLLCRMIPEDGGKLCVHGRFDFGASEENRLTTARIEGEDVTLSEGIAAWRQGFHAITAKYGKDAIGVLVSPKLTNEEMAEVKTLAVETLNSHRIGSLTEKVNTAVSVLGEFVPTSYEELKSADVIFYVGGDLMISHPVFGMDLRAAKKTLVMISSEESLLDDITAIKVAEPCETVLRDMLEGIELSGPAKAANAILKAAENPAIVWDKATLNSEEIKLTASLAKMLSCEKVLELQPACNSMAFAGFGFAGAELMKQHLADVKALFVIGESVEDIDVSAYEYLAVMSVQDTATVVQADVALPLASFIETTGTIINSEGKEQILRSVKASPLGMSNRELLKALGK